MAKAIIKKTEKLKPKLPQHENRNNPNVDRIDAGANQARRPAASLAGSGMAHKGKKKKKMLRKI